MTPISRTSIVNTMILGLLALSLAACSSFSKNDQLARQRNPAPCPNALVLPEASRVVKFNGDETLDNVAWTAEITNISSSCRYFADKPIEAQLTVNFAFGKGPMAGSDETSMTYFVAVTRTNKDLIAKEEFVVPVRFKNNQATIRLSDSVQNIIIPRKDKGVSGTNFEIIVGLSLSRDEILYNRSGKSLRFPNL